MNRYLVAVLLPAAAVGLRLAVAQFIGPTPHPFVVLFCGAAVAAAWYGGFRAGLVATALGSLALVYLFIEPKYSLAVGRADDLILLVSYIGASLLGSWLCENLHAARRRAAAAVVEERAWRRRCEAAVESSGSVLYDHDYATHRATFGGSTDALLGLPPEGMPEDFDAYVALVHPDDRAAFQAAAGAAGEKGGAFSMEYRLRRADGGYVTVRDDGKVVRAGDGLPARIIGLLKDVTEQRRAATVLRETSDQLRLALTIGHAAAFTWDIPGNEVRRLHGIAPALGPTNGQPDTFEGVLAVVHPDDRDAFERRVREAVAGPGAEYRNEYRLVGEGGSVRWVADIGRVEFSPDGRPLRLVGLAMDITARKDAEEQVRASEERLREYFDHAPASIAVFDRDMRYLHANRRWRADFGLGGRDLAGRSHYEVFPDIPDHWREVHRRGLSGEVMAADEDRFDRADGTVQWLRWEVRPWHAGTTNEVSGIIIYTEDITARKEAEAQLRRSRERLAATHAHAPVGLVETTPDEAYVSVNDEFCRITGYTRDELLAMRVEDITHPDDYPHNHGQFERMVAGEFPSFRLVKRYVRKDGSVAWADVQRTVLRDADGKPRYVIGAVLDVTERRQAEEQLRESEHRLRLAMEGSATGLWDWDAATDAVRWSPECYPIHGLTEGEFDGTAAGFDRLLLPADRDRVWAAFRAAVDARTKYECEFRIVRPDGEVRWVTNSGRANYDGQGRPTRMVGTVTDITARKQAEERLRLAVEVAGLGVIQIDYAADTSTPDATAAALFGMEPGVAAPRSVVHGRFHPDDRAEVVRRMNQSLDPAGDGGFGMEHRVMLPDGTTRWLSVRKQVSFGEVGGVRRPAGGVLAAVDITARKEAERQLQDSFALLDALFDTSPVGLSFVDADLRFVRANAHLAAIDGRAVGEFPGRPVAEVVPQLWPTLEPLYRQALAGRPVVGVEVEGAVGSAPGERRHFVVSYSPVRAGGRVVGVGTVVADVTDRRRAEERSRLLSEAAGVLLTTDAPNAMLRGVYAKIAPHLGLDAYFNFMVDDTGTGLRLASCVGVPEEVVRTIERLEFGQAVCGNVALTQRPIHACRIQRSDDPMVQLVRSFGVGVYACNPLMAGDRLFGTLSFASRSRDEFAADELDFLRTICQYVAVAYERVRLVGQLQAADRRKDEFLATLAHELRNPLAPIRNGVQILKMSNAGGDGPAGKSLDMMDRQLAQMVRLIDDLLDVSRITQGKLHLRRERVALADVLDAAVDAARPLLDREGHTLTVEPPPAGLSVDGDPARLAQVVSNLLTNAAKYTPAGGRVTLAARRDGGEAVLTVTDTGIGIPPAMLSRVFEMFAQVDRETEKATGGLGIGLALVRGLVGMHGGTIEASSGGEGTGSEFVVRLPAAEPADPPAARPPPGSGSAVRTKARILVVDDSPDSAESMALLLSMAGAEVRTAGDGLAGVAAAADFRPDLVLMDLGMPKLDGCEAARRLRAEPWGKGMVLVALTGRGQDEDRRKTQEAGFDRHLVKPVDPSALTAMLADLTPGRG